MRRERPCSTAGASRSPKRAVRAKSGACGTLTVASDETSEYAMADVFSEEGTVTDSFVGFRTVAGSRGSPDTARDPATSR
nr:catalase [Haladaptatus salinisoli]